MMSFVEFVGPKALREILEEQRRINQARRAALLALMGKSK